MTINRREFLKVSAAGAAAVGVGSLAGCTGTKGSGNVVIIGGGYGGATAAKYIRMWSEGGINVTLIERNTNFVSCPMSNLVLAGERKIEEITVSYDGLRKHGVRVIQGEVTAIDPDKRTVKLATGDAIAYDRLVVSPGIDFMFDSVPGLTAELSETKIFHAWKAGPQTIGLRKQLESMRDGGTYALCIPKAPFRCPPGPYERASVIAHYLKTHKPKSKVLVLDANDDIQSKKGLFMAAWKDLYSGIIEYRPKHEISSLDAGSMTVKFEFGDAVKADVLNIVPAQTAGMIAHKAGLVNVNKRWCGVDWRSTQSQVNDTIHVLGDATQSAPGMPKSGHMTTQHAKIAAAAIVNLMSGQQLPEPMHIANTCYSYVDNKQAVHVAAVYAYDTEKKTYIGVKGASGVSTARNEIEGKYAWAWAKNVWADALL
ncbi:MAG: NAD(P)/FAD-dependent oxidoreductase [Gammaproteobacteria bacterium]|nr:NAD(P)/FAD-dependent oxidoreductase [Gammaproteobacteria bacterium]MBU1646235.1 NAD(P)/FAD-dependent oxidoreductase [Gammaproteobacteria bacterium]MBU1970757.1 NAD(P)/FAD-dependent oxidoreductase [Gammaproteobacteria bacterium]